MSPSVIALTQGLRWQEPPPEPRDPGGPEAATAGLLGQLEAAVARRPAALALQDERMALSYGNLLGSTGALAGRIAAVVPAGQAVALACRDPLWQLVALLACLAAGRPAVPIVLAREPRAGADILQDVRPGAVVSGPEEVPDLIAGAGMPVFLAGQVQGAAAALPYHDGAPLPGHPALVLRHGAGMVAQAGLALDEAGLLRSALLVAAAARLGPEDRVLVLQPLDTIDGVAAALAALLRGSALQAVDAAQAGVAGVLDRLQACGATVLCVTPWMLRALLRATEGGQVLGAVRLVLVAGGLLHWRDIAALRPRLPAGARIQLGLGLGGTVVAQCEVPDPAVPTDGWVPAGGLRRDLRYASALSGELMLQGEMLALGRWEAGHCEAAAAGPGGRILASGVRGRMRPDGLLEIGGHVVESVADQAPAAVEAALRDLPEVADAAVLALEDADGKAVPVAFATLRPDAAEAGEATAGRLRRALPPALAPHRLHLLPELPRLPDAAPDAEALARHDRGAADAPAAAAEAQIGTALAAAWRSVLDRASLRDDLPFEAAGGDSLKLLQLALEVERRLGIRDLPLDALHAGMRPSEMRQALAVWLQPQPRATGRQGPLALFLPGLNGDEPALAKLRAELVPRLGMTVARYPGWAEMLQPGFGFPDIAAAALAALGPLEGLPGPVHLVGYSFGGHVAFLAAALLQERGVPVGSVCLIDASRQGLSPVPSGPQLRSVMFAGAFRNSLRQGRPDEALGLLIGENLARPAFRPILRGLVRVGKLPRLGAQVGFHSQMYLEALMRSAMLREWLATASQPPLREVPVNLLCSDQNADPDASRLGWAEVCPDLRIQHIPGSHHTIFDDGNRRQLRAEVLRAMGLGCAGAATAPGKSQDCHLLTPA